MGETQPPAFRAAVFEIVAALGEQDANIALLRSG